MGILIPMPRQTKQNFGPTRDIPAGGARIYLFLGVRYERHDDLPEVTKVKIGANPARARQRRRRA